MLDQLATPDFTVTEPAHSEDIAALAASDSTSQRQLSDEGFSAAASVRYSRQVDVGTSNGPIDVIATVELFKSNAWSPRQVVKQLAGLLPGALSKGE